jgi:hypothetical protein
VRAKAELVKRLSDEAAVLEEGPLLSAMDVI